jgi:maltose O-acetyltransferase
MPEIKHMVSELDETKIYEFKANFNELPHINKFIRIFLLMLNLPVINRFGIAKILKRLLGFPQSVSIGKGFSCKAGRIYCDEETDLNDTTFIDYAPIYIGKKVGFSNRNILITSTHDLKNFNRVIAKPIIIEDNVWITTGVIILAGVRVGRNSVIGAGSVVTKNIPPNVFAAGNPCVTIKNIERS